MKDKFRSKAPVLGPADTIGEGDSRIVYDCLSDDTLTDSLAHFNALKNEVRWQTMSHRSGAVPRLVCAQGTYNADGSLPIYRHPADQTPPLLPWSSLVNEIRENVQGLVGHEMNHCLIQLYRSGYDFISEHSDKTLDVVHGSSIVNVSLGAQRVMRLRTKRRLPVASDGQEEERKTQLVPMPHGSVFVLGLDTNAVWLHGINPDKRAEAERSDAERDFGGERISLTFRHIGTLLNAEQTRIWGQGATGKSKGEARTVINGVEDETEKMVRAFGTENHSSVRDWQSIYGDGFDVLNFEVKEAE